MASQLTIEETNRMIAFADEHFDYNSDVDQFIDMMVKEFFPDADIAIIKQMFEWAKYPDLKLIKVIDIMQIEKDKLTRQMKKKLNGTICSQQEYQQYENQLTQFTGSTLYTHDYHTNPSYQTSGFRFDSLVSFNNINELLWHGPDNNYYGRLYANYSQQYQLVNASRYIAYACVLISIWETKKKDHFQLLLSSNAKMVKQIDSLNGQLEYLQSQVYVSNNKISLLQTELQFIKAKFTPELVEYDYEAIKSRLDPIREELKMAQRLFARIIRNQYQAPMAVLVGTKSCK